MRVKLHREGTNILIVGLILVLLINVPLWLWVRPMVWAIVSSAVFGVTYLLAVNFFRSPKRYYKGERLNTVVSSADGKVVVLEETYEGEYLKGPALQLSVFMSPLNVHANWFPVDGEVIYTAHHSGRFMGAYLPKSSVENERSTVVIRTPGGQLVLVRQVAGAMARRIVTYGVEASIEDHMGFIKFGSRVDIYLPVDTETLVKVGDKTIGGITPIARLK
jgi:phosphatidylserine decarboxylase